MIRCGTWETGEEIQITYSKEQRTLYEQKDLRCIYHQFPRQVGINKGNFVEMVAKKYFEEQGMMLKAIITLSEIERSVKGCLGSKRFAISSARGRSVS
jgi:hypothetical protein